MLPALLVPLPSVGEIITLFLSESDVLESVEVAREMGELVEEVVDAGRVSEKMKYAA